MFGSSKAPFRNSEKKNHGTCIELHATAGNCKEEIRVLQGITELTF
jgi:hypothetical protein